jgi:hypothetical protein
MPFELEFHHKVGCGWRNQGRSLMVPHENEFITPTSSHTNKYLYSSSHAKTHTAFSRFDDLDQFVRVRYAALRNTFPLRTASKQ